MTKEYENEEWLTEQLESIRLRKEQLDIKLEEHGIIRRILESGVSEDMLLLDPHGRPVLACTEKTRTGTLTKTIEVNGENEKIDFGKPASKASQILSKVIEDFEKDNIPQDEFVDYLIAFCSEWSLDEDKDIDWWSWNVSVLDQIGTLRELTLGGNHEDFLSQQRRSRPSHSRRKG